MKQFTLLLMMLFASMGFLQAQPTTVPTAPTASVLDALAIYSEAYTTNIVTNTNPGWGQATVVTEETIAGNKVLKYASLNYQGTDYTASNVSGYQALHLDYWTSNSTAISIYIMKAGGTEFEKALSVVTGSWQSIDIPLTDFTGVDLTGLNQMKITGNGDVYFDNFYFWATPPAAGTDARLNDLKIDGSTLTGFNANTLTYKMGLVEGTTVPPTVTFTKNDAAATAVKTSASGIPGTTSIEVTALDGITKKNYTVNFAITIPSAGAPAPPARAVGDSISIFCNAINDLTGTNFNPGWGQSTAMTTEDIAGNSTLKYANFNYQGTVLASAQDVSGMEYMHVDMWTSDATVVKVTPIGGGETLVALDPIVAGSWQSYDIVLTDFTAVNLAAISQLKFDGQAGVNPSNIYLDNIYFWKTAAVAGTDATLSDLKVAGVTLSDFSPSKVNYKVGLVQGTTVIPIVTATTNDGSATKVISAATAIPGATTVEVTAQDGTTKKTYTINFAITSPSAGAPAPPARAIGDSISIFCNATNDVAGTNFNPGWGQSTVMTTIDIAGNSTLKYANFNFQGTNFASTIDASAMEFMHVDMWTNDATIVKVTPIGSGETLVALDPIVGGEWKSYDIPLSSFTAVNKVAIGQLKFDGQAGVNPSNIYLDNIYFWKSSVASNATLSNLKVGGTPISGFGSGNTNYTVILADGAAIPTVGATATNDGKATVTITQATGTLPASATVVVKSEDESVTKTYSVNFTLAPSSEYCETVVTHFNIEAEVASSIYLTIVNIDATSMYIEIESTDDDAVDELIVNNGSGATISDKDETVAGKIKRTLTWTTAPDSIALEILWSKASNTGNWMLNTFKVNFAAICRANTDARLSDIKVNGTTIPGFKSDSLVYAIELPYGSTTVPTVTATATDAIATFVITAATTIPDTTDIVVTAQDGSQITYKVAFAIASPKTDATLSDIKIDGATIKGFSSKKLSYVVSLDQNTTLVPTITCTTTDTSATKTITVAKAIPGTTSIVVKAQDGTTTKTYTVVFTTSPTYDVAFNVVNHGQQALADAQVVFMLDTLKTDINGLAEFTSVSPTTSAAYIISKEGYYDVTGNLSVIDANISRTITLEIKTYDVEFKVMDKSDNLLADAEVMFRLDTLKTDMNGIAVFKSVSPTTDISYIVKKEGYIDAEGKLSLVNANVSETVILELKSYTVTFNVVDSLDNVLADADVTFLLETLKTDANGIAEFTSVLPASDMAYTIIKEGYIDVEGSVSVIDADVNLKVTLKLVDIEEPVAIHKQSSSFGKIYPNPTNGELTIQLSSNESEASIELMDLNGRMIEKITLNKLETTIDLSGNKSGVYFLKITTQNGYFIEKIVISK